jgi:hypothetical protein
MCDPYRCADGGRITVPGHYRSEPRESPSDTAGTTGASGPRRSYRCHLSAQAHSIAADNTRSPSAHGQHGGRSRPGGTHAVKCADLRQRVKEGVRSGHCGR